MTRWDYGVGQRIHTFPVHVKPQQTTSICEAQQKQPRSCVENVGEGRLSHNFTRPTSENQTEQLVTDLQTQITQLVQLLEHESLKQMSIENRFQNEGREASLKLQRLHEEELRKIAEMHSTEIGELQNTFAELLEEERLKAENRYSELKIQYRTLQASFISFK
ncbi:hypothetical protein scyTo_0013114, partial [Scyliorhinus torazame]|nr:hypothetical protein [Scyliorhinus torazame]